MNGVPWLWPRACYALWRPGIVSIGVGVPPPRPDGSVAPAGIMRVGPADGVLVHHDGFARGRSWRDISPPSYRPAGLGWRSQSDTGTVYLTIHL